MCILDEVAYIKWDPIDMSGVLVDFSKSIILIIITSIVSAIVASKVLKAKITSSHLGKYGVMYVGSHGDARLRKHDLDKLFGLNLNPKPTRLSFFYINGYGFFNAYLEKYVVPLARKGCEVRVLICNYRGSHFLNDKCEVTATDEEMRDYYLKVIEGDEPGDSFLDHSTAMLADKGLYDSKKGIEFIKTHNHVKQSLEITELIKRVNRENEGKEGYVPIEIHYYTDEFRNPLTIAQYSDNKKVTYRVWTNLLSPSQEAVDSITVYAEKTQEDNKNDTASFVTSCVDAFNYLWVKYEKTATK